MSRRRAAHTPILASALACLVLVVSGCIFSPTEKAPPGPPPGPTTAKTPQELIKVLEYAYQSRNYTLFENLFPTTADNANYLFFGSVEGQTFNWDVTEELRIHRRMFTPENTPPGETPVPEDLWLTSITISLTPIGSFTERPDLYKSPGNPDGLDSNVWKAQESQYQANLFFDTQSTTDYRVEGKANFVVIENLTKAPGDDRKFLIYRWEDLGTQKPAADGVPAI